MIKKLFVGLTVGLLMSSGVAWAVNEATYNASTGVVNMPKVSVGADFYNVDMAQQGPGLDFLVTAASPATAASSENVATYNANLRTLHIPTVIVGADRYTADLAQMGEGYNFSVTSAVLSTVVTSGKIPDTGQTTSYTNTFGEDHDYTIHPPSYTVHGNGTVTDNVTGLMWQQQDDDKKRSWTDAATVYCDNLELAGHSDWRLPSYIELVGIVNYQNHDPAIDTSVFPNTKGKDIITFYWTSTSGRGSEKSAVEFSHGGSGSGDATVYVSYVRCVRNGQ